MQEKLLPSLLCPYAFAQRSSLELPISHQSLVFLHNYYYSWSWLDVTEQADLPTHGRKIGTLGVPDTLRLIQWYSKGITTGKY